MGERPTPDAPHPGKRCSLRAASCRPHSAQSQLARARAVGLVTGPHARTPRSRSGWVVGPAARPKGRVVGVGGAPDPGRPTPRQEAPPPGTLVPLPQRAKPARKSARCGVGDGSPRPHPRTHSQPGRTPERTSGRGWESARPRTPHTQARGAPLRAPLCRPHSVQSQLARARAVGLVTGPHTRNPRTHSQWVVGPAARPQGRVVGGGRAPVSGRPAPRQVAPPPGALVPPPQRAIPARKSARGGVGDGSSRPHPPHRECAAPSQVGGNGTGPPPPQASQTEHGTEAGHAEGHGPRGTALPAPSTGTARGARATPTRGGRGGGRGRRESASAQTHTKDTRGKQEGQPDRARGTHRPHGMAYQRVRIRDTQTGRPAGHSAGNAGREGGNGEDTKPGTGPNPPNWPRGPRTHDQGTAPAKAVVAHRATHQPQG